MNKRVKEEHKSPKVQVELSRWQLELLLDVIGLSSNWRRKERLGGLFWLKGGQTDFSKYDEQQLLILTRKFETIIESVLYD